MKIIGHRGGQKSAAPENSIERLEQAIKDKLDGIEIDLRLTKDKQLIVHHGPKVELDSGVKVKISQLSKEELSKMLPNLLGVDQAVELVLGKSSTELVLDCKGRRWARPLAKHLRKWEEKGYDTSQIIIISFYHLDLSRLKKSYPAARTYFLFRYMLFFHLVVCKFIRAEGTGYNWLFTWRPLVWFSHLHKLKIYYYTVNGEGQATRYDKLGVDYLCTDYPKKIRDQLNR